MRDPREGVAPDGTIVTGVGAVARAARELGERHGHLVREVGISTVDVTTLARPAAFCAAERCFLRHYCRHLVGPDLRAGHGPCRASVELAIGFNGDLADALTRLRAGLTATDDPAERAAVAARACRRILMAAATLLSAREGGWSTDRSTAVELIGRHAPDLRTLAADARAEPAEPAGPRTGDVVAIVDRLGG